MGIRRKRWNGCGWSLRMKKVISSVFWFDGVRNQTFSSDVIANSTTFTVIRLAVAFDPAHQCPPAKKLCFSLLRFYLCNGQQEFCREVAPTSRTDTSGGKVLTGADSSREDRVFGTLFGACPLHSAISPTRSRTGLLFRQRHFGRSVTASTSTGFTSHEPGENVLAKWAEEVAIEVVPISPLLCWMNILFLCFFSTYFFWPPTLHWIRCGIYLILST